MLQAVRKRRSIRRYQDRSIEPEVIAQLQESMLRAPSSRNLKPWRFVFVTDRELLGALPHAKASYGEFVGDAALGVVICGDAAASDCWIEDCSIAAATLQLAAADADLGSCWIQIRARQAADGRPAEDNVREILGLATELSVLCIVAVGYSAQDAAPRPADSLDWDKVTER
jgi:nitroreductase